MRVIVRLAILACVPPGAYRVATRVDVETGAVFQTSKLLETSRWEFCSSCPLTHSLSPICVKFTHNLVIYFSKVQHTISLCTFTFRVSDKMKNSDLQLLLFAMQILNFMRQISVTNSLKYLIKWPLLPSSTPLRVLITRQLINMVPVVFLLIRPLGTRM